MVSYWELEIESRDRAGSLSSTELCVDRSISLQLQFCTFLFTSPKHSFLKDLLNNYLLHLKYLDSHFVEIFTVLTTINV